MENLVYVLPALACPVGMVLMMWFMGRGSAHKRADANASTAPPSIEQLREEHQRIAAELERLDGDRDVRR